MAKFFGGSSGSAGGPSPYFKLSGGVGGLALGQTYNPRLWTDVGYALVIQPGEQDGGASIRVGPDNDDTGVPSSIGPRHRLDFRSLVDDGSGGSWSGYDVRLTHYHRLATTAWGIFGLDFGGGEVIRFTDPDGGPGTGGRARIIFASSGFNDYWGEGVVDDSGQGWLGLDGITQGIKLWATNDFTLRAELTAHISGNLVEMHGHQGPESSGSVGEPSHLLRLYTLDEGYLPAGASALGRGPILTFATNSDNGQNGGDTYDFAGIFGYSYQNKSQEPGRGTITVVAGVTDGDSFGITLGPPNEPYHEDFVAGTNFATNADPYVVAQYIVSMIQDHPVFRDHVQFESYDVQAGQTIIHFKASAPGVNHTFNDNGSGHIFVAGMSGGRDLGPLEGRLAFSVASDGENATQHANIRLAPGPFFEFMSRSPGSPQFLSTPTARLGLDDGGHFVVDIGSPAVDGYAYSFRVVGMWDPFRIRSPDGRAMALGEYLGMQIYLNDSTGNELGNIHIAGVNANDSADGVQFNVNVWGAFDLTMDRNALALTGSYTGAGPNLLVDSPKLDLIAVTNDAFGYGTWSHGAIQNKARAFQQFSLSFLFDGVEKAFLDQDGYFTSAGMPVGRQVGVPANASAPGKTGDFACDGVYAYFCTATSTWARCAVATW
jgi:hypothetical protein